jgi:hypothetical protein
MPRMKRTQALATLPALLGAMLISSCASAPKVDPTAQAVLLTTTEKLRAADTIQASGTRLADPGALGTGSTREFVNFDIAVERPGTFAVRSFDGQGVRHTVAGNGGITIYDEKANAYSTTTTQATDIDGLVDDLEDKFDVKMALSEMFGEDPMSSLMEGVTEVKLGGYEKVGNQLCTRLDFTQKDISWQLWVAKSDSLPRMFSITDLEKSGHPKRIVTVHNWKLDQHVPDKMFALSMKKDAQEVDVVH